VAKYGQADFAISVGGTDMSQHVDTLNSADIEAMIQQSDTFGDSWVEQLYAGVRRMEPVVAEGFYDDTATTGPDAKFGDSALGTTVAVVLTWGGSKTSSFNAIISRYSRTPGRGELSRYSATLTPTGAVTEA
jgi:hypothetical protein